MAPERELEIREFENGDERAFRELNEEWITRYFALEPKDVASLADPQAGILDRAGRIFLAIRKGQPVGCCALLAMGPGEFEVAKMAVTASCRGRASGGACWQPLSRAPALWERAAFTWRRTVSWQRRSTCTNRWAFATCRRSV